METALTLNHFLLVSGVLFAIGLAGVLVRRNLIIIFMCLELMLAAANLTLVAFSRFNVHEGQPNYGLAIIVALFRTRGTADVTKVNSMKY